MTMRIYLSPPEMLGNEFAYLKEAFDSNWIAPVGPFLERFEKAMTDYTQCENAVALASGTAAIHLGLEILGLRSGDRILCPSLTFVASVAPAIHMGAEPVFIDCATHSWNMCPDLLEEELKRSAELNKLPKAIIVVHLYGFANDMERIMGIAERYQIPVLEDASESLGTCLYGRATGTFGDIGVYSFNGNKLITTSGGGMLVSRDAKHVARARYLATQARQPVAHYEHTDLGYNYRLSNLLAAVGLGQLEQIDKKIALRRRNYQFYQKRLQDELGFEFFPLLENGKPNHWLSCALLPSGTDKTSEDLRLKLSEHGIESRAVWKPMHMQPVFKSARMVGGENSEEAYTRGICLPSGSTLTEAQLEEIIALVKSLGL